MLFSSIVFLFTFLPAVVILYYLLPVRFRNVILLLASLVFYAWGEPVYLFLMLLSILFNYFSGLDIARNLQDKRGLAQVREAWRLITFSLNAGQYLDFFLGMNGVLVLDTLYGILPGTYVLACTAGCPIGISRAFYTIPWGRGAGGTGLIYSYFKLMYYRRKCEGKWGQNASSSYFAIICNV